MHLKEYDYELPPELIAQEPLPSRECSRLLVIRQESPAFAHRHFIDILEYLREGDVLVANNTRVIPARLFGRKNKTGAVIEVVLLRRFDLQRWEALVRPGKRVRPGTEIEFGAGELTAVAVDEAPSGGKIIEFKFDGVFEEILERLGQVPLPPYIKKALQEPERYQTVYARNPGSAAAPTAGLHFTPRLLEQVKERGAEWVEILLHVGLGTFRPVKEEEVTRHKMHEEYYEIAPHAAAAINKALAAKRRIIAVGTTSTRALESACVNGSVQAGSGFTDIFIYPGYEFKVISGLVTNFHLPKSTLLMLVSALVGREKTLAAYDEAIKECYRFFSFGDAMLII